MSDPTSVLLYIKQMLGDLMYINGIIATELINITENTAAMRHGEDFLAKSPCISEHEQLKKNIVNIVKNYKQKPEEFIGNLINTGLYKFTPEIFEALEKIELSPRGEYELTDAITILAKQKKVKITKVHDYWLDMGSIADIPKVEAFLNNWEEPEV